MKLNFLNENFFNLPKNEKLNQLFQQAEIYGEKRVMGMLQLKSVFYKNSNPARSKDLQTLRHLIAGSFKGKTRVPYPSGLSKR